MTCRDKTLSYCLCMSGSMPVAVQHEMKLRVWVLLPEATGSTMTTWNASRVSCTCDGPIQTLQKVSCCQRQKRDHDTRVSQNKFQPGDLVWKRYHVRKKLERPWVGPYVIRKVLSDCLYLMSDKKSTYALHHDLLKPYTSTHVPRWAQQLRATC